MSYLKHKPGSIEEMMANNAKKLNDSAYQQMFKKELEKAGKGIGSMSPKEKKDFFNKIDSKYKAKSEDLNSKDASVVKKVVTKLKGASQAHAGQAKDLEKAMKTESFMAPVRTMPDGKGNFNLTYRGKEIGYYKKERGKYVVYHSYDKKNKEYSQSDMVSTPDQAKKMAYDNMNEADQHGDEINQKKIDKIKADKKMADSGSKVTKVETEPKVDYKN